jgi:hypothetical protein
MEGAVQPVAAGIAGEGPAGAVAAVGSWGETYQQKPGIGIAESRHRPPPVFLTREGSFPLE